MIQQVSNELNLSHPNPLKLFFIVKSIPNSIYPNLFLTQQDTSKNKQNEESNWKSTVRMGEEG